MLFSRKIGAVLRGNATPLQVMLATVLGGLLGFLPGFFLPGDLGGGFAQSPGLILVLLCAVLMSNANLGVFGLTLLVAKLLSFALISVSYAIGTWLLDGPLSGLFAVLVNGKITAWFGLEYYATSGGLVVGCVFGICAGFLVNRMICTIRNQMAERESNSERYQVYAKKWWVRLLSWILLGKSKGDVSWQELRERQAVGSPIRVMGVVAALVLVVAIVMFQSWFSTPLVTRGAKVAMESMNGATVDVQQASLSILGGTLQIDGLAIADSRSLDEDLFAADMLVASVDAGELLRRCLVIDEIRSSNARSGTRRIQRGVMLAKPAPKPAPKTEPIPAPAPAPAPAPVPPSSAKSLQDHLQDYALWRGRLEQLRDWMSSVVGSEATDTERTPEQRAKGRRAQESAGLATVVAEHLLIERPRFVIRKLDIEGADFSMGGRSDKVDLRLRNLSDAPSLLADVMTMALETQSKDMRFELTGPTVAGEPMGIDFTLRDLSIDGFIGQLRIGGEKPVSGGSMDLSGKASLRGSGEAMTLELPLQVSLKNATFQFSGLKPTKVSELLLPIGFSGSLTDPLVSLDDKALQRSLLRAGQAELANFVQKQAGKLFGVDLSGKPDKVVDQAKDKLKSEAQKAAEAAKKKLLKGGLRGLLPGGRKKKK